MYLTNLKPKKSALRNKKTVGRGNGAGHGKTACRGCNGAGSRSGSKKRPWFEGGQMPLQRRLPKRGFYNRFSKTFAVVNIGAIDKKASDNALIDADFLKKTGLIKSTDLPVKILGTGEISKPVTIKAGAFSTKAVEKLEKSGGKAELC